MQEILAHTSRLCVGCNREFLPNTQKQINCSRKCRDARQHRERRDADHSSTNCLECGGTVDFRKNKRHRFCSRYCNLKNQARRYGKDYATAKTMKSRSRSVTAYLKALLRHPKRKELTLDWVVGLYDSQVGKCAITGFDMTHILGQGRIPTNMSIDKIDCKGGYINSNVRLVCISANIMKFTFTDDELIVWCRAILRNLDKQKCSGLVSQPV